LQFLLPGPLKAARDQPILRLDGMVLPGSALRFIGRPLPALLPVRQQGRPLLLDLLSGGQRQLQGSRLQGGQHLLANKGSEARLRHMLAEGSPVVATQAGAFVGVRRGMLAGLGVMDDQARPTMGADDESREQRRPVTYRAHGVCPRPVGLQTSQVALVLVPGDVRRTLLRQKGMPVRAAHDNPATAWMVGLFAAWVILASAIDVGTGVEGMFEQVLQRHAVGSTPDQLTLPNARPFPDTDTKADVVASEIPQEAAERAKYLKLLEDEPHHLL